MFPLYDNSLNTFLIPEEKSLLTDPGSADTHSSILWQSRGSKQVHVNNPWTPCPLVFDAQVTWHGDGCRYTDS